MEPHWEWCHNCGFDPENRRPATAAPLLSAGGSAAGSLGTYGGGYDDPAAARSYDLPAYDTPAYDTPAPPPGYEPPAYDASSFETSTFDASTFSTSTAGPPASPGFFDKAGPNDSAAARLAALPPPPGAPPRPPPPGSAPPLGRPARPVGAPGRPEPAVRSRPSLPRLSLPPAARRVGLLIVGGVVLLAVVTTVLVKVGGEPRALSTSTTVDPKAPPPIGQIPLGGRSTTTAAPEVRPGWTTYRSPDGTFSVAFPGRPEARGFQLALGSTVLNGLRTYLQVGTDGPEYAAVYSDLPTASEYVDSQDLFDRTVTASHTSEGLLEVAPGLTAVRITSKPGKEAPRRGMLLLKGKRIYMLETANVPDPDLEHFLGTFRWLADPTT